MAAAPEETQRRSDSWSVQDSQSMVPGSNSEPVNNASLPADDRVGQDHDTTEYTRGDTGDVTIASNKTDPYRGEKQVKPNKVYIGGLPENTRQEDLQNCFGKIGKIVNIELKVGYGFVEFDNREAAEESVAKYHEGYFMGNKIRVELSRGGRTAKFNGDPGACFKCGDLGHWARECPNNSNTDHQRRPHYEPQLLDRIQRDYTPNRSAPSARDDSTRYPPRDARYDYHPPAPPTREARRPPSPTRDYREYSQAPRTREYDDYRRGTTSDRDRYGPPPQSDYRGRLAPPAESPHRSYGAPAPPAPPASYYDRYDRRPNERYAAYPPPGGRARTPPRARDDYERERYPPRDYHPDFRGRPPTPPPARYPDYVRTTTTEPPTSRYRRRSESPPPRTSVAYDQGYSNGYSGRSPAQVHRGSNARDYPPPRSGREPLDVHSSYRRP